MAGSALEAKEVVLMERAPTVEEFHRLRRAVGWGCMDAESTAAGLANALYSVCLMCGEEIIGCGRVIGDAHLYFYIQDIIVVPAFQGKGCGRQIMAAIFRYLEGHAQPGAFIGLMAAKGKDGFYEKLGFITRPSEQYGPGMCLFWKR